MISSPHKKKQSCQPIGWFDHWILKKKPYSQVWTTVVLSQNKVTGGNIPAKTTTTKMMASRQVFVLAKRYRSQTKTQQSGLSFRYISAPHQKHPPFPLSRWLNYLTKILEATFKGFKTRMVCRFSDLGTAGKMKMMSSWTSSIMSWTEFAKATGLSKHGLPPSSYICSGKWKKLRKMHSEKEKIQYTESAARKRTKKRICSMCHEDLCLNM